MKCEKCGYSNSEYDIICEQCGAPLNIENNIELQKKYNNKQRAIDIEKIVPDNTELVFNSTKRKVSIMLKLLIVIFFIGFILLISYIYNDSKENNILVQLDDFLTTNKLGVIYIGNDKDITDKLKEYEDKYNINYKYFNSKKINRIKKQKIKNKLKVKNINNTIFVLKDNRVVASTNSKDNIEVFLQNNEVLPKYIGDAKKVVDNYEKSLLSDDALVIYMANNKNSSNEKHQKDISEFCKEYEINYTFIEGYYLTDNQKLKLLNKLNYSEIHDELLIIVDERQVLKVTETVPNSKSEYFEIISNYGIIDERSAKEFDRVSIKEFKTLISSKDKNVILIENNDCSYCEKLKPIVGKIALKNNFKVYSIVLNDNKDSIEGKLKELGYEEEKIVPPLVIITEDNHLLDYIIGLSDKNIYIDKFIELGIIR